MRQQMVTIEGTHMASVKLPRGQRQTVVDTPQIRERVRRGQVKIVATYPADETTEAVQPDPNPSLTPPAKNASRDDWAAFVGDLVPRVDFDPADPDVGRNDLIALYEQWRDQHAATEG